MSSENRLGIYHVSGEETALTPMDQTLNELMTVIAGKGNDSPEVRAFEHAAVLFTPAPNEDSRRRGLSVEEAIDEWRAAELKIRRDYTMFSRGERGRYNYALAEMLVISSAGLGRETGGKCIGADANEFA